MRRNPNLDKNGEDLLRGRLKDQDLRVEHPRDLDHPHQQRSPESDQIQSLVPAGGARRLATPSSFVMDTKNGVWTTRRTLSVTKAAGQR